MSIGLELVEVEGRQPSVEEISVEPVGQEEHEEVPPKLYVFGAQTVQPDAVIVPAFVTVPEYPGAQIVHADTDALPIAEPEVKIPTGQDVHDDEPGVEE